MIRSAVAALLLVMAGGCREEAAPPPPLQAVDLSEAARREAVIEAATTTFEKTVKDPWLTRKHMTVRGLARAATRPQRSRRPMPLSAAQYDPAAGASAKLELVKGKVLYTVAAAAHDPSAAIITDGSVRWRVGYEISAQLTPEGELTAFTFHHLGEARPE